MIAPMPAAHAAGDKQIIAQWLFNAASGNGKVAAAVGENKLFASFQAMGGPVFEEASANGGFLKYQGWHQDAEQKYWLAALSTEAFENITVSSVQNSSGSGPKDFQLQISTNQSVWQDVPDGALTMAVNTFACADAACRLSDLPLPQAANNQQMLYLRWLVASNEATNSSNAAIGQYGSSAIKDIVIKGDRIPGQELPKDEEQPTTPTDVMGQALSDSSIQLDWTASTDNVEVAGYQIYRDGQKLTMADAPPFQDQGLASDTSFTYTVSAVDSSGNESTPSTEVTVTTLKSSNGGPRETIALWAFTGNGDNGTLWATDGTYKQSSMIRGMGGVKYESFDANRGIYYNNWNNGAGNKYWLATVSTKGFEQIKVSSEQRSSNSGPRDFQVQMSTDRNNWTDIQDGELVLINGDNCPGNTCKLVNASLPAQADNEDVLYIRWVVRTNTAVNAIANPNGIGSYGSSYLKDVRITGSRVDGAVIQDPTIVVAELPIDGEGQQSVETPISISFNKAIKLNPDYAVSIVDGNQTALTDVKATVSGKTLHIAHPILAYEQSYTVSLPKELILGEDDVMLLSDYSWSFSTEGSPFKPKLLNMTINGDPKTSMAFAWYTDTMTDTVVEVTEAVNVKAGVFPKEDVLVFKGTEERIETFMVAGDRAAQKRTPFVSHKAIADQLEPGTHYKFRLGNGEEGAWSKIGSFTTDTANHQDYRFIVGADSQSSSLSGFEPWGDTFRKAVDYIGDPKFLIVAGDLVDNGDLETHWQWMFTVAEDSFLRVPYIPVLGGHEVNDYDGDVTTDNNNFYNHFNVPQQIVASTHEGSVYSFEYGDALYMVFNSQYEGGLAGNGKDIDWEDPEFRAQVNWMRNTVARSDKKWKFVAFHKSPYASGNNSALYEDGRVQFYRQHLTPVFDELGIDMVFEAHDHMYMRSFQMYGNEVVPKASLEFDNEGNAVNPKGTIYLMPNALGNKFYTKQEFLHEFDENWNPVIKKDEFGNPIPYDHFFADVNEQPFKKMFTDVAITDQILSFKSFTAAVEDEGEPGTVGNGLIEYDKYGIKRTDAKPDPVEKAQLALGENEAVLTWDLPADSKEPIRGFRIYEENDKAGTHWSVYIPVKQGQTSYSFTARQLDPAKKYDFIVKAVGTRMNSDAITLTTMDDPNLNEPPSAPTNLTGKGISSFQIELAWQPSAGNIQVAGYEIYRDNVKIALVPSKETTYTDRGLQAGKTYSYYVKALNGADLASIASNRADVKTKEAASGSGPNKSFPQHPQYAAGTIKPNHVTQADMDTVVQRLFQEWRAKYLKANPYDATQKYIWYTDDDPEAIEEEKDASGNVLFEFKPLTVSEAHGYGMMIIALMAKQDADTQADFDALYHYFRAHPSEINPQLMAWRQGDNGQAIVNVSGADAATDGDMDIAYALLLADQQWGSGGDINYLAEAKKVIAAIMESEVYKKDWTLRLADWASSGKYVGATRPSDFMLQHMKDYAIVTGDSRWDLTVEGTYRVINDMFENYSPNAGLLPDFVVKDGQKFVPAEPHFLESKFDGDYYYNSARTPWRIATDYLVTGDQRAKKQLTTLNEWIRKKANNKPENIFSGYKLDGSAGLQAAVEEEYEDITFIAPFMVSAMIDSSNQQWLNDLWDYSAAIDTEEEIYFGNNIRMLSMIVVSGNWWSPAIVDTEAPTAPVVNYANAVSNTSIELRWLPSEDNVGVAGYKVYRDGVEIASTTETKYVDTGLTPNKQYAYVVVAYDAAGNSSKSSNMRLVTAAVSSSPGGGGYVHVNPNDPADDTGKDTDEDPNSGEGAPTEPTDPANPVDVAQPSFTDIDKNWAKAGILAAVDKGIISGFPDGTFRPNEAVTRAQFAIILSRALGMQGTGQSAAFKDEGKIGPWAAAAIAQVVEAGIVNGYPDGTFRPNAAITRAEMAVMLARAGAMQASPQARTSFSDDHEIAGWAKGAVEAIRENGLMQGRGNNHFAAASEATRAEAVIVALRLMEYLSKQQ
ncbi:licheninase [Paenibacillaceae bacterium]|nr:licheninase [Paenibacillaceae bacterium]